MLHARDDYQGRIVDNANKIPTLEPVFLLRGQDLAAPRTLLRWAELNLDYGGDPILSRLAREQAEKMMEWQLNVKAKPADR